MLLFVYIVGNVVVVIVVVVIVVVDVVVLEYDGVVLFVEVVVFDIVVILVVGMEVVVIGVVGRKFLKLNGKIGNYFVYDMICREILKLYWFEIFI